MEVRELSIPGAWEFTPRIFADNRGFFLESFKIKTFEETTGHQLDLKQMNISVSKLGTVRGIHFTEVPPGQAKYVQCLQGKVLDVVVDLCIESPTFGQWAAVELTSDARNAVFVSAGLGHGFSALTDQAAVGYLCDEEYSPHKEHGISPFDPSLGIDWRLDVPVRISDKDRDAPSLEQALASGILPKNRPL